MYMIGLYISLWHDSILLLMTTITCSQLIIIQVPARVIIQSLLTMINSFIR